MVVYSLLQELARRDGLSIALSGLNEDELAPVLTYLSRNLTTPRFTPLLLDVCNMVTGNMCQRMYVYVCRTANVTEHYCFDRYLWLCAVPVQDDQGSVSCHQSESGQGSSVPETCISAVGLHGHAVHCSCRQQNPP